MVIRILVIKFTLRDVLLALAGSEREPCMRAPDAKSHWIETLCNAHQCSRHVCLHE